MTSVVDSEVYSRGDSDWHEPGCSSTTLLVGVCARDSFWDCLLDLEVFEAESPGSLEVLLRGCKGMEVPLWVCPVGGS